MFKKGSALEALDRFFRSVKLAVVLLLIIVILSIMATLIPQTQDPGLYFHAYPPLLARVVIALGFDDFFRSLLFPVPVGVFFVNLSVCAVDRLVRRSEGRAKRRRGPDLIHVGLLVLIVGAMVSVFFRREATTESSTWRNTSAGSTLSKRSSGHSRI
jgi:cytochrome c biogenesis protein ResB